MRYALSKFGFTIVSVAPLFGQSTPNSRYGLLPSPFTSVPNSTTFDHTVLWAAIDFSGRIKFNKKTEDRNTMGASLHHSFASSENNRA